jgi:hypothetical protein
MACWRNLLRTTSALVVSLSLGLAHARPGPDFATVVHANSAQIGRVTVSPGTTVLAGDSLATTAVGELQIRAGAARVVLSPSTRIIWGAEQDAPAATIGAGAVTFSTANSRAFTLRAGTAVIRPTGDGAAIGNVSLLNPKELTVACSRGSLLLTVMDDSLVVPEGTSYYIVLDPDTSADDPKAWGSNQRPKKSGRNRFLFFLIGFAAVAIGFTVYKVFESPERP